MNPFQAEALARMAHRGHLYGKQPYIEGHVIPVVDRVIAAGGGPDAQVVAWLHDVLEDTRVELTSQPMLILTRPQAAALAAITRKEGEDYDVYVLRASSDPVARLVKYCDLQVNLSNKPPEHLRQRYVRALDVVRTALDNAGQIPTRAMLRISAAAAAEIDAYFTRAGTWMKREQRAAMVLDWCDVNGWFFDEDLTVRRLEAAMARMPYWQQGPANYFDVARAISAALLEPLA